MVITRHDELVADVDKDVEQAVVDLFAGLTEGILPIRLPAEVWTGPNWADMVQVV